MNDTVESGSRFTVSRISRSSGACTVALAALRHATAMTLPSGDSTRDHGNEADQVAHSEIALPDRAPAWAVEAYGEPAFAAALEDAGDAGRRKGSARTLPLLARNVDRMAWARLSERLWLDIEHVETVLNRQRHRAELARSVVAALPATLSQEARIDLVREYVQDALVRRGAVVDWVLRDGGRRKPLAFMMFPTRHLGDEAWGGRAWKMHPYRLYMVLRATWLKHVNRALHREGIAERLEETPDGRRLCLTRTNCD